MLFSFISLIVIILVALFVIKSFSLYKKRAEKKKNKKDLKPSTDKYKPT